MVLCGVKRGEYLQMKFRPIILASLLIAASSAILWSQSNSPTVYVATAANGGSDANDCSKDKPCATLARAAFQGSRTYANRLIGDNLVVQLGAGSFSDTLFATGPLPMGMSFLINPNSTTYQPGQIMVQGLSAARTTLNGIATQCGTLVSNQGAVIGIRNITIVGTGNGCNSTLFAQLGGKFNIYDGVVFGAASVDQIHIEDSGSIVEQWSPITIAGGANDFVIAADGTFKNNCCNVTLSGTPSYVTAFAVAAQGGGVQFNNSIVFTGATAGRRFVIYDGGRINAYNSTSLKYLPGNSPGTVAPGGIYDGGGSVKLSGDADSPQGRLSPDSSAPVVTGAYDAVSTVYYRPYRGADLPLSSESAYLGSYRDSNAIPGQSVVLTAANAASGTVHDLFEVPDVTTGAPTLCIGPAWQTPTGTRGVGAQLSYGESGVLVNFDPLAHCWSGNGTVDQGSVVAGFGVYLGTLAAAADGQYTVDFGTAGCAGGCNLQVGLYNAYNRIRGIITNVDSNASWTQTAGGGFAPADGSNLFRNYWLDGLAYSFVHSRYSETLLLHTTGSASIGTCFDCNNTVNQGHAARTANSNAADMQVDQSGEGTIVRLGLHYAQAVEATIATVDADVVYGNAMLELAVEY